MGCLSALADEKQAEIIPLEPEPDNAVAIPIAISKNKIFFIFLRQLVNELTNEVELSRLSFPTPALPGSGYKGMISACFSSRPVPGKGTPKSEFQSTNIISIPGKTMLFIKGASLKQHLTRKPETKSSFFLFMCWIL